jgi:hypothetical protein
MAKRPKDWRPRFKPRKSRAKYGKRLKAAVKRIRHGIALLKRKKIVPQSIDARKILPDANLRRLLRKNQAIIRGEETTYAIGHLPSSVINELRSLGYRVSGKGKSRRLVVPKTKYVRKGKVYERPTESRKGYRIEREKLTPGKIDAQIRKAFAKLKSGDMMGFEIGGPRGTGGKSWNLYGEPNAMIEDINRYTERDFIIEHIVTFIVSKATVKSYLHDSAQRARQSVIGSPEYRRRKQRRWPRKNRRNIRTSRGH